MTNANDQQLDNVWQLQDSQAQLNAGLLRASVNVEHPSRGLQALQLAGAPVAGWLLGVAVEAMSSDASEPSAAWPAADVYVRGADLVASYREPLGRPFNVQIYWRVVGRSSPRHVGLETMVSVQTLQWEAYPAVVVASALPVDHLIATPESLIYRATPEWSYAEAPMPGDFTLADAEPATDRLLGARWRYGGVFMERGVIRRLRLRGAIVPRSDDGEIVARLRDELVAEPPPLSA